jgi:hypothetical protein
MLQPWPNALTQDILGALVCLSAMAVIGLVLMWGGESSARFQSRRPRLNVRRRPYALLISGRLRDRLHHRPRTHRLLRMALGAGRANSASTHYLRSPCLFGCHVRSFHTRGAPAEPQHRLICLRPRYSSCTYLLISSCLQNLSNSTLVHLRPGRQPALHSSFVGLMTRLSPPFGTGSVFGGTVGPDGGVV